MLSTICKACAFTCSGGLCKEKVFPADPGEFNTPLPNPAESQGNLPVVLWEVCGEENSPGKNKRLKNLLSLERCMVVHQS